MSLWVASQGYVMKTMMKAAALGVATMVLPSDAEACSCIPTDIVQGYRNVDHVVAATVLDERVFGQWRVYEVYLWQSAKSCVEEGAITYIGTAADTAACGTQFQVGGNYVLFANDVTIGGSTRMVTNGCLPNTRARDLTRSDWDFLTTRPKFCPDEDCSGGQSIVPCFVDPCTVSTCSDTTAVCEPNYCGGCEAEWYDSSDAMVCMTP